MKRFIFIDYKVFVIVFLSAITCACDNNIGNQIALMQSDTICLDIDNMLRLENEYNSRINTTEISHAKYKWIIFHDSVHCKPCQCHDLLSWQSMIDLQKEYKKQISTIFIYSADAIDSLEYMKALDNIYINYPIFLDTLKSFRVNNKNIPNEKIFHTFLLDDKNKVILVGNPMRNPKVNELFIKILRNDSIDVQL